MKSYFLWAGLLVFGIFIGCMGTLLFIKDDFNNTKTIAAECISKLKRNNEIAIQCNADVRTCTNRLADELKGRERSEELVDFWFHQACSHKVDSPSICKTPGDVLKEKVEME